jgi:hypothetical protein
MTFTRFVLFVVLACLLWVLLELARVAVALHDVKSGRVEQKPGDYG